MLLFRSEEHVGEWCRIWNISKGELLSLDQGWRLARAWYSDRLDLEWRRKTIDEAEQIFAELGLTSLFWDLRA
jgi:hypothetical protein